MTGAGDSTPRASRRAARASCSRQWCCQASAGAVVSTASGPRSSRAAASSVGRPGTGRPSVCAAIARSSSRRLAVTARSDTPSRSRVRSWTAPMLSTAHWSCTLMSRPMPVYVSRLLLGRVEAPVVVPVADGPVVGQRHTRRAAAPAASRCRCAPEVVEDHEPVVVLVVDGHVPLAEHPVVAERHHERVGEQQVRHADVAHLLGERAHGEHAQPVLVLLHLDVGPDALADDARTGCCPVPSTSSRNCWP